MSGLAINIANGPALPSSRAIGNRWWTAIEKFFTVNTDRAESAAPRQRGPRPRRRYDYLEYAAMSRAMERL